MTKTDSLRMTPFEWVLLVVLGAFWGAAFFFNAVAIVELPPLVIILFRVGLAAAILWAVVLLGGVSVPRDPGIWSTLTVMAAMNSAVPFFLIAWGQIRITGGLAAILIAMTPLFGVIAAHYLADDERMTPLKVIGVLVGFAGAVFLIGPEFLGGIGADLVSQLAVLAAAFCYALSAIYGRRFAREGISPMIVATGQLTMATALLLPFALIVDRPWSLAFPSLPAAGAVIGLAVLSTAFGYLIYFRILATAGATNILLVNFLVPVSALLLGIFILGETLTAGQAIGMACIALGLALIDGRVFARRAGGG